ncbi:CPBP family intramembrane glutamic endopeptidase [Arenibacter echinorum]|uniref:CAAX prenyl protease-like protein n=1 Tax=Arenibacter echinorum TaxID=440515 RepID=A0A327R499_9FLAO|nr:CPBP family intramembrane glutamic endopeptidase [Arenibacter echinorum]RAJ11511.1 CAAX prenyl protease-like protein [Arenibacter echinorum]
MKSIFSKHPVLIYFALVFIISWSMVVLLFGTKGIPATGELQESIGMTILLGPSISGILLTLIYDKRKGLQIMFSKLLKWKIGLKWYFIALLTAPLTTLLGILLFSFFSENYSPNFVTSDDLFSLISLGIIGGVFVAIFEELGWTGFAIPKLKSRFGVFNTGMIVGILWGAWHFILFWEKDSFSKTLPFLLLILRLFIWLPAYRIIMVWLYDNTSSLLIIVLMHTSLVASLVIIDPTLSNTELMIYILIRAIILWAIVGSIFLWKPIKNKKTMSEMG